MLRSSLYSQASQYHHLPPYSLALPLSNARANSDTRNRIAAANSKPRHIKLVGLPNGGAQLVSSLPTSRWKNVEVVTPADGGAQGRTPDSLPSLDDAEMIFIIACSGDDLSWAALIQQIARGKGILTTGILVASAIVTDDQHAELRTLRAATDMLVIASDASYVPDMLTELGA